ncbi:MAG: hypothetical protein AAGK25_00755 [Pseudomonadota bacterium]
MKRLNALTCVITGAAHGFGYAIAKRFGTAGAHMTGAKITIDGGLLAGSAASPGT